MAPSLRLGLMEERLIFVPALIGTFCSSNISMILFHDDDDDGGKLSCEMVD